MTTDETSWFNAFADRRAEKGLKPGQRWLTCDDVWQKSDEYDGGQGWWRIGGPETGIEPGTPIDIGMLCYTPRGKR